MDEDSVSEALAKPNTLEPPPSFPRIEEKVFDGKQAQGGGGSATDKWKNGTKTIVGAMLIGAALRVFLSMR